MKGSVDAIYLVLDSTTDHWQPPPAHMAGSSNRAVALLGTGRMAQALAMRLADSNWDVRIGTRHTLCGGETYCAGTRVVSYHEATSGASMVVLALPVHAYAQLLAEHGSLLHGKTIVDVSNPSAAELEALNAATAACSSAGSEPASFDHPAARAAAEQLAAPSAAEWLQQHAGPSVTVVKAFNNLSAQALLSSGPCHSFLTVAASDVPEAAAAVAGLAAACGILARTTCRLKFARKMEEAQCMPALAQWRGPAGALGGLFALQVTYCAAKSAHGPLHAIAEQPLQVGARRAGLQDSAWMACMARAVGHACLRHGACPSALCGVLPPDCSRPTCLGCAGCRVGCGRRSSQQALPPFAASAVYMPCTCGL